MSFKSLFVLAAVAVAAVNAAPKKAVCSAGRTASNAAVRVFSPIIHLSDNAESGVLSAASGSTSWTISRLICTLSRQIIPHLVR